MTAKMRKSLTTNTFTECVFCVTLDNKLIPLSMQCHFLYKLYKTLINTV